MILSDIIAQVHGLVINHLPAKTKRTPSQWISLNCPMCSDNRQRGGIKIEDSVIGYNCFNCNFSTRWEPGAGLSEKYRKLARAMGATDTEIHDTNIKLMQFRSELDGFSGYQGSATTSFRVVDLPAEAELVANLNDDHPVKQYAANRQVLGLYPLLWFNHRDIKQRLQWKDRLVVPYVFNGDLVGWTGRHINPPDKQTPKYLSNQPEGFVFNLDAFGDDRKIVVLVEGVLDAILIDGISVLGNSVSEDQARLINSLDATVIVCPDRDQPGKELINAALTHGWRVSFPDWAANVKDVGDAVTEYGRLLTLTSIIQASIQNPTKIKVKAKML